MKIAVGGGDANGDGESSVCAGSGLNFNMYNYLDTTNDVFVTNTKIIDLAANDYVTVVFNIGSGGSQSDSRMTFDGFLIG